MMTSVLIVSEAFTAGGLETHISGEIDCLTAEGWKVHLACGENFYEDFLPASTASVHSGLPLGPLANLQELRHTIDALRDLIRRLEVPLVHIHPYTSLIPAMIAAEVEGVATAVTVHGPSLTDGTYGRCFDFLLDQVLLPNAGHVFAVSEEIKSVLVPFVSTDRLTVLPNGVALPDVGAVGYPLAEAHPDCWLLASRLDKAKLPGLLAFLRYALSAGLGCIHVAGDGPARQDLAEALRAMRASNRVSLLGVKRNLSSLMPGYRGVAGMGRVVLEALATGCRTCLVGYDGVKGVVTQDLFERAAWSNFSGRGLPSITEDEFITQIKSIGEHSAHRVRPLLVDHYDERVVWRSFADVVAGISPQRAGFLTSLYAWLVVHGRPESKPHLRSPQMEHFVARLATAPRYYEQRLGDSYLNLLCLENQRTKQLELHETQRRLKELEGETEELRSTLQESKSIADQRIATQIEEGRRASKALQQEKLHAIEALQQEVGSLRTQLVGLGDWAAEIDRNPLRHALKKTAVYARRAASWAIPLNSLQRQRLRGWLRRAYGRPIQPVSISSSTAYPRIAGAPLYPVVPRRRDILVFAVIDWHFRFQRPQQLALGFAHQGSRVFYISNHFTDSPDPGYSIETLDPNLPIYQVHLSVVGAPPIYYAPPGEEIQQTILGGLGQLLFDYGISGCYGIAHHPFWQPVIWSLPNCLRIYDCMDHHEGFGNVPSDLIAAEKRLLADSDLVVTTSVWLENFARHYSSSVFLIRNAADYAFFSKRPERVFADDKGRKVIGYYGAIAEWFDLDLVRAIATSHPDALVLLVGNDTVNARKALADLSNVEFTGEVPYRQLPYYLYGFDVCLLPFRVMPLTLATNPVKVYEYLAAGRPVVAPELPELHQFGGHVVQAIDRPSFARSVTEALSAPITREAIEIRQTFAKQQTWEHRAAAFLSSVGSIHVPRISVVVLTFNNLDLTRACVTSIFERTSYPNLEILIVDNDSTDGTREYVSELESKHSEIKVILNESNLGFAQGNNVGLAAATGDYLVLLNNDTVVTEGWALTLLRHLQHDAQLGIIGPVTDNIGNEACIEIPFADRDDMHQAARRFTLAHIGESFPIRTLAFFCVMFPRRTYEQCGGICTDYGVGFFEDDDYCRRIEQQGWGIRCAEDVFIHHHLSASFSKLAQGERDALFERNRVIYEKKWGPWIPHRYR